MTIKLNHTQWSKKDSGIDISKYSPDEGLVLGFFYEILSKSDTVDRKLVEDAWNKANLEQREFRGDIVITIYDSCNVPENDRNAPILGSTGEKKQTGDTGEQYYNWRRRR